MIDVAAVALTVLNLLCWVGILFNLPGTWLMVLVTAMLKWWQPGYIRVSWTSLSVAASLALLGEVLEFALSAAGARQAGGSTWAVWLRPWALRTSRIFRPTTRLMSNPCPPWCSA
jgi:uncharacterized protein YqgC (DUF456 family)